VSEANNLSPEAPWPGLKSYNEEDHEFFCGRDEEIHELLWLVRRNVLTVVFGPSGTGKSSLVQAGLFPALRKEGFAPYRIRLEHGNDLIKQVQRHLNLSGETLWEGFHRLGVEGQAEPVVVFDQFEEIFTFGDGRPESERFLEELADLVENYYPRTVRQRLEKGEQLDFSPDRQGYHVMLVLREDFVWRLDGLRTRMPAIMRERFILKPFTEAEVFMARRNEPSPNRMKWERHSLFAERTHRSAKAFRFGLRVGSRRHFTPPVASVFRKSAQNLVSPSCNT